MAPSGRFDHDRGDVDADVRDHSVSAQEKVVERAVAAADVIERKSVGRRGRRIDNAAQLREASDLALLPIPIDAARRLTVFSSFLE